MKYLFILTIFIMITSCSPYSPEIERTLRQAGDNRAELEHVLKHFAANESDSLKLRAAEFLIANMQYHGFVTSQALDKYYRSLDTINRLGPTRWKISAEQDSLYKRLGDVPMNGGQILPDSRTIKAEDLINHIDATFSLRDTSIWCKNIPFDVFCEYLLPYRVDKEKATFDWPQFYRDSVIKRSWPSLADTMTNLQKLNKILEREQSNYRFRIRYSSSYPGGFEPRQIYAAKIGTCRDFSILSTFLFRSVGFACTIDYTPVWGNRSMGHDWNVMFVDSTVIDTTGTLDFSFSGGVLPIGQHMKRNPNRPSKIYRMTYSAQANSLAMKHEKEGIPSVFFSPCMKDVSNEYNLDKGIRLKVSPRMQDKRFYYLATFDNQEWKPVAWSEREKDSITFQNIGAGIIYLPSRFDNDELSAIDYPILVRDSDQLKFEPDTVHTQSMTLYRKYSKGDNIQRYAALFAGGRIEVSNDSIFRHGVQIIHHFADTIPVNFNRIDFPKSCSFRYLRFIAGKGKHGGEVAEFEVYDTNGRSVKGDIKGSTECTEKHPLKNVADGDALTYYETTAADGGWVGFDFGKPTQIGYVRILPRNDDNFIRAGETYELQYWNLAGWKAIGRQCGTTLQYLTFENCPSGALYRLRNLTKGKEERIFTYEDGKQIWW